jgi:hypothetical protein
LPLTPVRLRPVSRSVNFDYAPKVGLVRVGWRGAREVEKETLALVKRQQLSSKALAKVRKDAMELDKRAYKRREFYRKLQPAKPLE